MKPGLILSGHNLSDNASIESALNAAEDEHRFYQFTFTNDHSYWTAHIVFFQGLDESGDTPPDFSKATGVTVGGVDVTPHSSQTSQIQPDVKCQATRITCVAGLVGEDGDEDRVDFDDLVADPGTFFLTAGFRISDPDDLADKTNFSAIIELRNNKNKVVRIKRTKRDNYKK